MGDDLLEMIASSEAATRSLAARTLREEAMEGQKITRLMEQVARPAAEALFRGKGKMSLAARDRIAADLKARLEAVPEVLELRTNEIGSRLSSRTEKHYRFLVMSGQEETWATFWSAEVRLMRQSIVIVLCPTYFYIHRHALERFIQREKKPLHEMFAGAAEAVRMAPVVGMWNSRQESENIALPIGSGLLLGKMSMHEVGEKNVPTLSVMRIDRDGPHVEREPIKLIVPGLHQKYMLLTYVDADALTDSRRALHTELARASTEYDEGLRVIFDAHHCPMRVVVGDEALTMVRDVQGAQMAVGDIVSGPAWATFQSTARRAA